MGFIDFKFKLADIAAKIRKQVIGINIEKRNISIQAIDESTHMHYHNEIGLSDEDILRLPSRDIGDLVKHQTILNIKAALYDKPKEMAKYLAIYNGTALTTGATSLTASVIVLNPLNKVMSSGDFIEKLPGAIAVSTPDDTISVKDVAWLNIDDIEYRPE